MLYKRAGVFTLLSLLSPLSFAFFCPTNFNQIEFGMTVAQVTSICGKPISQTTSTQPNENVPQEWNYFVPQTNSTLSVNKVSGSMKTSFTFDATGKLMNISVNGFSVGNTNICGGRNIQIGATRDMVKAACGAPGLINRQSADASASMNPSATSAGGAVATMPPSSDKIQVTQILYNANPPVTLVFENGVLTSKH